MKKIKYKFQRAKKGYCDYDLYDINGWFINIFPKMLGEFAEQINGHPCNEKELIEEVYKMPTIWVEEQRPIIDGILKKYEDEFCLEDAMCCWLLIILRMKYCFELCDDFNEAYKPYWKNHKYEELNERIKKIKKEGFYLFEKYFFDLWW